MNTFSAIDDCCHDTIRGQLRSRMRYLMAKAGNALYWAGIVVALLCVAMGIAVLALANEPRAQQAAIGAFVSAVLAWAAGRTALYLMAKR